MNPAFRFAGTLLAAGLLFAASAHAASTILSVRVVHLGPGPLEEDSVRALLSLREGEPFDRSAVIADVKNLEQSGRFERVDVRAEPEAGGVNLIVEVRSKPRLLELTLEGTDDFSNSKVLELLAIKPGDRVDDNVLAAGANRVLTDYRKKYHPDAQVTWEIQTDEKTGLANVRIRIREGKKVRVRTVGIHGTAAAPVEDLKAGLQQKVYNPWNPWHWVTSHGRYDPDAADGDAYRIRKSLLDLGYLDATVKGPEILETEGRLALDFVVQDGRLYRIGSVAIEGNTVYGTETLMKLAALREGEPASMSAIEAANAAIQEYYGNRGYFRTRVQRSIDADAETGRVAIRFRVEEGILSKIRDVRIQGNATTQDKVILREVLIAPGERYDFSKVRASERRLRNLGYFDQVSALTLETPDPAEQDLVFEVEEGRSGMATAGVGFSSIEAVSGYVEISHGNMDLGEWPPLGGGQKVRLRLALGTESQQAEAEFIEPWFLDRPLSLGVNLFRTEYGYYSSEYDQRNTGIRLSLTKSLGPFWRGTLEYSLQNIEIFDVSADASEQIKQEEGDRIKSALTPILTYDSRKMDYRGALPSGGNLTRLSVGYAGGPLGGETDLYDLNAQTTQFIGAWGQSVVILRGRAGVVAPTADAEEVPLFDRYFLGGPNSVRGFEYREIGPRDEDGEPLGGETMVFASAEYTFPLVPKIRGAVFYDSGMIWADAYEFDSDLDSCYGIGLRLDIPMMPIRLDYAWVLNGDEYTERGDGRFSFWIGHSF